jgi:hypothetical protein
VWSVESQTTFQRNIRSPSLGSKSKPSEKQREVSSTASRCFLHGVFRPRKWWRHVPLKRLLTSNGQYGLILQKVELFMTSVVRTSNSKPYTCWQILVKIPIVKSNENLSHRQVQ